MCGIIGYVGSRECKPLLLQGLERLEYRGYDSSGIALLEDDGLAYVRAVGPLENLKQRAGDGTSSAPRPGSGTPAGRRTAAVTEANAHPLAGCEPEKLSIVLNGIVENYRELRESLAAEGHTFTSETDAETVTHLVERHYEGDLAEAVRRAFGELEGHFAFVVIHARPSRPARRSAPPGAARRRHRSRRDLPRVQRGRLPQGDASRAVPRRRRDRRGHARRHRLLGRRRDARRARDGRARLGRRGRGEGRLRDLHAEGDLRAADRRRRHDRRPRAARQARARGPRHERRGAQGPAPDRPRRVRHRVPRVRRRALRDRGVGARPRRVRHRERVDLPQPGHQQARPRDRDHAVRRDARHDRGDAARARARGADGRDHEHDGLADHARGRLRAVHARRPGDGGRVVEDVHRAGRAPLPGRAQAGADPRDDAARASSSSSSTSSTSSRARSTPSSRATIRSRRSRAATTRLRSSSTSAATSACPSRSRARSS